MKNRKKQLKEFMESVPHKDYKRIKDLIILECKITDDIWANWLTGRTKITELAKPIIIKIAERDIFNETPIEGV